LSTLRPDLAPVPPSSAPAKTADHQEAAAALAASERLLDQVDRACPTGVAIPACLAALAIADDENERVGDAAMRQAERLQKHPLRAGRAQMRESAIGMMLQLLGGRRAEHVRHYGKHLALLSAMRVELEVRRRRAHTGQCPTLADFDVAPLAALRSPTDLGGPLAIVAVGDAGFRIVAPPALHLAMDQGAPDQSALLATLHCTP
jgi:hypothetical protein